MFGPGNTDSVEREIHFYLVQVEKLPAPKPTMFSFYICSVHSTQQSVCD